MTQEKKIDLKSLSFSTAIKDAGGKIYSVGGAVRDSFLGKESKDLDILVTGIPIDDLQTLLSNFGKATPNEVGGRMAIIKLKIPGDSEEIDVAIPRTETKTGEGYTGFDVRPDHNLSVEDDLFRRDFTINAIAQDEDGNIIDPFNGVKDLEDKVIRMVNPDSFKDDPLRMMRAVQFAPRFGFEIEPDTFQAIKDNAPKIKEITAERIMLELEKLVKKGDKRQGLEIMVATGLFKEIFGKEFKGDFELMDFTDDMGDFIFAMLIYNFNDPKDVFKNLLKGDVATTKKIGAITLGIREMSLDPVSNRTLVHKMNNISPSSLDSRLFGDSLERAILEMKSGKFPISLKEVVVGGEDLMEMGFSGKRLGDTLNRILTAIYREEISNTRDEILKYAEDIR